MLQWHANAVSLHAMDLVAQINLIVFLPIHMHHLATFHGLGSVSPCLGVLAAPCSQFALLHLCGAYGSAHLYIALRLFEELATIPKYV